MWIAGSVVALLLTVAGRFVYIALAERDRLEP
jgi:hypothetical protein